MHTPRHFAQWRHAGPALAILHGPHTTCFPGLVGSDWRYEADNAAHSVQLRGIVGFRMRVASVELKFKLNQNHPEANVRGAAAALAASAREGDREIAALMTERLQRHPEETQP